MDIRETDEWYPNSIFSTREWCSLIGEYKIYGVYKGYEFKGGIIGFPDNDDFKSGGVLLTPYQGIVGDGFLLRDFLREKYNRTIQIINHWTQNDVRPFLWRHWNPIIKYTYLITKDSKPDKQARYDIKNTPPLGKITFERFCELYESTFIHKGLKPPVNNTFLEKLFNTFECRLFGNETAATVFITDKDRAYYILGASEGNSSRVVWDSFQIILEEFPEIDLVGCNDEKIANFKKGFGGKLTPYLGCTT